MLCGTRTMTESGARPILLCLSRRHLLAALSASGAAVSLGCAAAPILPVTRPDPARFEACPTQRSLTILTWNIFMMPQYASESPRNEARAAGIAAALLEESFDIICFQKAFDSAARDILEGALAARYPYRYGPANNNSWFYLNSGVWVLSRHPLTDYQQITYGECSGVECFCHKGALLLSGTCGATPFRLVATHLQGEEGSTFTAKNQAIRDRQMLEIRDRLITPHLEPGVPFIVCGDFGTPRLTADNKAETTTYRQMLATLGVENGADVRITLDERTNQLARSSAARTNELDYIFLRKNCSNVSAVRTRRIFRRPGWDPQSGRSDLSYRYAVSATLTFGV